VIEGQTKLVLRDPEIYDAPFHSFSVVPDVTQSGDQSSSIPNVSHGPERRKRSSLGHRQVTHLHSFGHKA